MSSVDRHPPLAVELRFYDEFRVGRCYENLQSREKVEICRFEILSCGSVSSLDATGRFSGDYDLNEILFVSNRAESMYYIYTLKGIYSTFSRGRGEIRFMVDVFCDGNYERRMGEGEGRFASHQVRQEEVQDDDDRSSRAADAGEPDALSDLPSPTSKGGT